MSEKPGKRLVTWEQYVKIAAKKGIAHSLAYILLGSGITLICLTVVLFWTGYFIYHIGPGNKGWGVMSGILGVFTAGVGAIALWGANSISIRARKIDQVELITCHNIDLLPPEETLVRASGLPPSDQQAELLRGVAPTSETPPEELLRATTNTQGD